MPKDRDPIKELRRQPRRPLRARAAILWEAADGKLQFTWGQCINVSESGMEIQVSELIPALSYVYVRLEGVGIEAYGRVRHANQRGTIGVEFAEGRVWNYAKAGMK